MADNKWREEIDLVLEENIKQLIKETKEFDSAIRKSKDPGKAQIWMALAIMNHKINMLSMGKKAYDNKIPREELDKILKTLETL